MNKNKMKGSEWEVMDRIKNNKTCENVIDEMYVEFHPWGNPNKEIKYYKIAKEWVKYFKSQNITLQLHD